MLPLRSPWVTWGCAPRPTLMSYFKPFNPKQMHRTRQVNWRGSRRAWLGSSLSFGRATRRGLKIILNHVEEFASCGLSSVLAATYSQLEADDPETEASRSLLLFPASRSRYWGRYHLESPLQFRRFCHQFCVCDHLAPKALHGTDATGSPRVTRRFWRMETKLILQPSWWVSEYSSAAIFVLMYAH